ncbi:uncharacterized protein LOC118203823 [Stegodyphus dumicola]|uniref:uncharacterized protein LOC118203823 n=1 Tax=Stegodyphus dumicola TaxID=202533 RepID=UPI0015AC6356|nr:uncharacterized protein LOC118203823 [Stegodyphus dumicola]
MFSICDKTEREQQINLAQAINNSQDHEKMYREKTKYLSLIAGTVGAFLGLIASTVNVWRYRKEVKDIKNCAGNISCDVNELKKTIDKLSFPFLFNGELINPFLIQNDRKQGEDLLSKVKLHQELLDNCIKNLSVLVSDKLNKGSEENGEIFSDMHIKHMLNNFEENINSRLNFHSSVSLILLGSLLAFSIYAFVNR